MDKESTPASGRIAHPDPGSDPVARHTDVLTDAAFTTMGTMTTTCSGITAGSNAARDNINLRTHDGPRPPTAGAPTSASASAPTHEPSS